METPNLNQLLPSIFCLLNQELRPDEFNYSFEDHIFVLKRRIPKSSITQASVHLNSTEMCPASANS